MRLCTVDDCEDGHAGKGYCNAHYQRWRRYGDPTGGARPPQLIDDEGRECFNCDEYKPWSRYNKKASGARGHQGICKSCHRGYVLQHEFGISIEDYEEMLDEQGGTCAICSKEQGASDGRDLCVDHDHDTGEVRGLLCGNCNKGIGNFRDDPELLQGAIEYLKVAGWRPVT